MTYNHPAEFVSIVNAALIAEQGDASDASSYVDSTSVTPVSVGDQVDVLRQAAVNLTAAGLAGQFDVVEGIAAFVRMPSRRARARCGHGIRSCLLLPPKVSQQWDRQKARPDHVPRALRDHLQAEARRPRRRGHHRMQDPFDAGDGERRQGPQTTRGNPRITRFGPFIRRTSLDELPQFINVQQGSISIGGLRPHAVAHNEEFRELVKAYMLRHNVKPCITGWAQVNGLRGETETVEKMAKRVRYDIEYLRNWSLTMGLRIIARTTKLTVADSNAY